MAEVYKDRRSDIFHALHSTYSQSYLQTNAKIGLKTLNKIQNPTCFDSVVPSSVSLKYKALKTPTATSVFSRKMSNIKYTKC